MLGRSRLSGPRKLRPREIRPLLSQSQGFWLGGGTGFGGHPGHLLGEPGPRGSGPETRLRGGSWPGQSQALRKLPSPCRAGGGGERQAPFPASLPVQEPPLPAGPLTGSRDGSSTLHIFVPTSGSTALPLSDLTQGKRPSESPLFPPSGSGSKPEAGRQPVRKGREVGGSHLAPLSKPQRPSRRPPSLGTQAAPPS